MFKVNNKNSRTTSMTYGTYFTPFSSVYFVDLKRELGRDCLNNFFVNTVDKLASQNL